MKRHAKSLSPRSRLLLGGTCVALGSLPIAISLGAVPTDSATVSAPAWVLAAAGLVFVIAGLMILLARDSRANDLLAGVLLLTFAAIGSWASLFSDAASMTGGLPFLSREANVLVGRWVFGIGAVICFLLSFYAFRRGIRGT